MFHIFTVAELLINLLPNVRNCMKGKNRYALQDVLHYRMDSNH